MLATKGREYFEYITYIDENNCSFHFKLVNILMKISTYIRQLKNARVRWSQTSSQWFHFIERSFQVEYRWKWASNYLCYLYNSLQSYYNSFRDQNLNNS